MPTENEEFNARHEAEVEAQAQAARSMHLAIDESIRPLRNLVGELKQDGQPVRADVREKITTALANSRTPQ